MRSTAAGLGPNPILHIYPTALKVEAALAEAAGGGCVFNHRFTTFPQLTDRLFGDVPGRAFLLGDRGVRLALEEALDTLPGHAGLLPFKGLVAEAVEAVRAFEVAYLRPEDVAACAEPLEPPARRRVELLAELYARYRDLLSRAGAGGPHEREWRVYEYLTECLATGRTPRVLAGVRRVVFAEIYDYSLIQFLIAVSLIRLVGDAELITFASPENVRATTFLDRTWNRFVETPVIADRVLPDFVVRGGRAGNLEAALRTVFVAEPPAVQPADGSVRVIVAPTRYREVEAVGRDIRDRLAEGSVPERIAILTRDIATYGDLIEDVCRRYRIPVYFQKGKPLAANGVVREIVNVLRAPERGLPGTVLAGVLRTSYFRTGGRRTARLLREAGYLDRTSTPLRACLARHRERRAGGLAERAEAPAVRAERLARLDAGGRTIAAVAADIERLDRDRTFAEHVAALRAVLRGLGLHLGPAGDMSRRRDAAALAQWEALLDELAEAEARLCGGRRRPFATFVRRVLQALEHELLDDPSERAGSVRALSVEDARGLDFELTYVVGLDDGTFPSPVRENPILPDPVKVALNGTAAPVLRRRLGVAAEGVPVGLVFRTTSEERKKDPFYFFLALSTAERGVVLSYPRVNDKGNPAVPSAFVGEVLRVIDPADHETITTRVRSSRLIPVAADCREEAELVNCAFADPGAVPRDGDGVGGSSARVAGDGPAPTALRAVLSRHLGRARIADIAAREEIETRRARYFLLPAREHGPSAADRDRKAALADAFVGHLAPAPAGLREAVLGAPISVTGLEHLGACGFRFFAAHVLGLREDDEPEREVGRRDIGWLAHEVLRALFAKHPMLAPRWDDALAVAAAVLAAERERLAAALPPKDEAFFAVAWERVEAMVRDVVCDEHGRMARLLEPGDRIERLVEWGFELPVADVTGGLAGATVLIRGRLDRADLVVRDGRIAAVSVLDYKASKAKPRYQRALRPPFGRWAGSLGVTAFQVPVYLMAVLADPAVRKRLAPEAALDGRFVLLRHVAGSPRERLEPGWISLEDDERRTRATAAPDTAAGFSVPNRIVHLVAAALAGSFDVDPQACERFCAFRHTCRYSRGPFEAAVPAALGG